jgi:hypothetical protein
LYERSALPAPPDIKPYIRRLAEALTRFPVPIGKQCCDPISGVTRRLRWRPEINDVLEFCERRGDFYEGLVADRRKPIDPRPMPHSHEECIQVQRKCEESKVANPVVAIADK